MELVFERSLYGVDHLLGLRHVTGNSAGSLDISSQNENQSEKNGNRRRFLIGEIERSVCYRYFVLLSFWPVLTGIEIGHEQCSELLARYKRAAEAESKQDCA